MSAAPVISGIGGCLPPRSVSNSELSTHMDTSDEWIRGRTGIARRRWVDKGMSTSDLAVAAGRGALESAGATEAGLVIVATTTPDHKCPSTAPAVAWRLGLGEVPAFDLNAVCSGFVYALSVAAAQIRVGAHERVLVIGADTFSTIIDPLDRTTAVLFGDGAGAVLLEPGDPRGDGRVVAVDLGSDGSGSEFAVVPAGGSRMPGGTADGTDDHSSFLALNGRQIYVHAVDRMTASTRAVLAAGGWSVSDLEVLVAHQANQRILDAVGDQLGLPARCRVSNLRDVGNTAAASVPLALADAAAHQSVRAGSRTALTAFGGGLAWGAVALTWPGAVPVTHAPASGA